MLPWLAAWTIEHDAAIESAWPWAPPLCPVRTVAIEPVLPVLVVFVMLVVGLSVTAWSILAWARPHADGFISDVRDSIKKTAAAVEKQAVTQERQQITAERQVEISSGTRERVEKLDVKVESIHGMVKDLHRKVTAPLIAE